MNVYLSYHKVCIRQYQQQHLYPDQGRDLVIHDVHILTVIHQDRLHGKTQKTHQSHINCIHYNEERDILKSDGSRFILFEKVGYEITSIAIKVQFCPERFLVDSHRNVYTLKKQYSMNGRITFFYRANYSYFIFCMVQLLDRRFFSDQILLSSHQPLKENSRCLCKTRMNP